MLNKDTVNFAILLSALLALWGFGIPVAILAAVVVITYYYVKRGIAFFAYGGGAVFLVTFIISGFSLINAFMLCLYILPMSFLIGLGFRRQQSLKNIIMSAGLANLLASALFLGIEARQNGRSVSETMFLDTYNTMKDAAGQSPLLAKQYMGALEGVTDSYLKLFELFLPALLIISSVFSVYVIFGMVRGLLGRAGMFYDNMPYFYQLRMSRSITSVFLFLFIASALYGPSPIILNIILVIVVILMTCGLSVADYFLKLYNIPGFARFIIYVTAIFLMPFFGEIGALPVLLLFGAGTADSYFELRRQSELL